MCIHAIDAGSQRPTRLAGTKLSLRLGCLLVSYGTLARSQVAKTARLSSHLTQKFRSAVSAVRAGILNRAHLPPAWICRAQLW